MAHVLRANDSPKTAGYRRLRASPCQPRKWFPAIQLYGGGDWHMAKGSGDGSVGRANFLKGAALAGTAAMAAPVAAAAQTPPAPPPRTPSVPPAPSAAGERGAPSDNGMTL